MRSSVEMRFGRSIIKIATPELPNRGQVCPVAVDALSVGIKEKSAIPEKSVHFSKTPYVFPMKLLIETL